MTPREEVLVLVQRIIRESGLSTAELARATGLSRAALNAWLAGARVPQRESLAKLADGLEGRSDALRNMAGEIRQAAGAA